VVVSSSEVLKVEAALVAFTPMDEFCVLADVDAAKGDCVVVNASARVVSLASVVFSVEAFALVDSVVIEAFSTGLTVDVVSPSAIVAVFGSAVVSDNVVVSSPVVAAVDSVETGMNWVGTVVVFFFVVELCHGFVQGAVELAVDVFGAFTNVVVVVGGTVRTMGPALKVHFCCSLSSSQGCMETELTSGLSGMSSCKQWLSSSSPSCSRPVSGSNLQCWLAAESPPVVHGQM